MTKRFLHAIVAVGLLVVLTPASVAVQDGRQAQPGVTGAGAGRRQGQRGRGGDPFAGQPRVKALIVSGGCCHDYSGEAKVLMDTIGRVLPVDWTLACRAAGERRGSMPVYDSPDWAKGFDIVVHNECLADVDRPGLHPEDHRRSSQRTAGDGDPLLDAFLPRRDDRRLAGVSRRHQPRATRRSTRSRSRSSRRITAA